MKKSLVQVTLEYLFRMDPEAIGFTRSKIFNAIIPATEGLKGYNTSLTKRRFGNAIDDAVKNKSKGYLGINVIEGVNYYFLKDVKPLRLETSFPSGYGVYISSSRNSKYAYTHLYKMVNGERSLKCKSRITDPLFDVPGVGGLCPTCLANANYEDLKSKFELMQYCYDRLRDEKNALETKNNELESLLLKTAT
jgi:hypothetical protein